jgi:hypothetical protein
MTSEEKFLMIIKSRRRKLINKSEVKARMMSDILEFY